MIWVSVQLCSTHHFLHMCAAVKRKGNKLNGTDFHERCTQVNLQPVWINKRHTHAHTLSHLCFGHTCLPNELISIFVRCSVLQTVVWHHFFSWFSFLLAYIQPRYIVSETLTWTMATANNNNDNDDDDKKSRLQKENQTKGQQRREEKV